ncbi:type II toxin-antitoxin system RelE/ParE family toxin [Algoriphagus boseongensis]|uniref:type II toxin-antitoxin system RelE/ParE family toxin n=1 Tax=Algoriphagus boseongensis TaxID=1442587 RepID=UPI001AAD43BE
MQLISFEYIIPRFSYASLKNKFKRVFDILLRLQRVEAGNLGDVSAVGEGIEEFRIHYGPGYRIYFRRQGEKIILLLVGGDKSSQESDIKKAKALWNQYKEN